MCCAWVYWCSIHLDLGRIHYSFLRLIFHTRVFHSEIEKRRIIWGNGLQERKKGIWITADWLDLHFGCVTLPQFWRFNNLIALSKSVIGNISYKVTGPICQSDNSLKNLVWFLLRNSETASENGELYPSMHVGGDLQVLSLNFFNLPWLSSGLHRQFNVKFS